MSASQIAGLLVAGLLLCAAAYNAVASRLRRVDGSIDSCAADALALAAKLRAADCPEGVAACQALLNVILEHPGHKAAEVKS